MLMSCSVPYQVVLADRRPRTIRGACYSPPTSPMSTQSSRVNEAKSIRVANEKNAPLPR